jgi:sugar phosphate permease
MVEGRAAAVSYRHVVLGLIMAIQTAGNIGVLGLPSLAPLIREDLALSRLEAGSFVSAFYVGGVLTSFPAGWLADRVGVRWTLLSGQALTALGFALMTLAPAYGLMMGAVTLAGVCFGAVNPTSTKGVLIWFPARSRATVVGIKQAGFPLGGALGALLLPWLAVGWGWRGALLVAAALMALSALLVGVLYREPPALEPAGADRPPGRPDISSVLRSRPIRLVAGASLVFAAVQVAWISYLPLYLGEVVRLSPVAAGFVLGQAQVAGTVGRVLAGFVSDRVFGGRRLGVLLLAGTGTALLTDFTARLRPDTPVALLSLLAIGFGLFGIGWNGVHHALVAEMAGRDSAATAVGLCLAVSSVGVIAGAPLFGFLADRAGDYAWGWHGLAAAMVAALGLLLGVREPRRTGW